MSDKELLLDKNKSTDSAMNEQAATPDNAPNTTNSYNLATVGMGAVFGALIGAAAAAFASKITVENINNTVKGVGETVKGAAEGINTTVKGVGNAVKNVAENVDSTLKDVGTAVKSNADEVNQNLQGTVDVVKNTAQSVNYSVRGTADVIKNAGESVSQNVKSTVDAVSETVSGTENQGATGTQKQNEAQTACILVPVDKDKYMMPSNSTDSGTNPQEVKIE